MDLPANFHRDEYPLYEAQVDTWGGFLFVNLGEPLASSLTGFLGGEAENVKRWPLAGLVSVHREVSTLACNWKLFWENYSECYHCPGIHPELCRVVPLYREGLLSYTDSRATLPPDQAHDTRARVAAGFSTWTLDGQSKLPLIDGPDAEDRALGVVFASFTASLFVVAHPDYVRSVRILPRGPETRGTDCRLAVAAGCRRTASGGAGADVRTRPPRRRAGRACLRDQPAGPALAPSSRRRADAAGAGPARIPQMAAGPTAGGNRMRRATVSDAALRRLTTRVSKRLRRAGLTIVTAESCTGGLLAKCLTDIAGSSDYFDRGWVTYSNAAKRPNWASRRDARALRRRQRGSRACDGSRRARTLERPACDRDHRHRGSRGRHGREAGWHRLDWLGSSARGAVGSHATLFRFRGGRDAVRRQSVVAALKGLLAL